MKRVTSYISFKHIGLCKDILYLCKLLNLGLECCFFSIDMLRYHVMLDCHVFLLFTGCKLNLFYLRKNVLFRQNENYFRVVLVISLILLLMIWEWNYKAGVSFKISSRTDNGILVQYTKLGDNFRQF
jgi:hypothetical protein